jgi:hypothetical protein
LTESYYGNERSSEQFSSLNPSQEQESNSIGAVTPKYIKEYSK